MLEVHRAGAGLVEFLPSRDHREDIHHGDRGLDMAALTVLHQDEEAAHGDMESHPNRDQMRGPEGAMLCTFTTPPLTHEDDEKSSVGGNSGRVREDAEWREHHVQSFTAPW